MIQPDLINRSQTVIRALMAVVFVLVIGTAGYVFIEGWSVLDSFFMTVITITTIGFEVLHPLSRNGVLFTLFIVFAGIGIVGYSALAVARMLVEGDVERIITRRRTMKEIQKLRNHFVVCGFGRMGSFICQELRERSLPFVVIEHEPERQDKALQAGFNLSPGDATEEDVMLQAGIKHARALVAVLDSDAANVYTVLTARELNPQLEIIARAGEESAQKKLLRAGANRVISPYKIGGIRLVMGILKPAVMSFLEVAFDHKQLDLELEQIGVAERSVYSEQRLVDTGIRRDMDLIIIAIKKQDGQMVFNPGPYTVIEGGDTLIAMGDKSSLAVLEQKAGENL
ncbi:MAG: NAD-binding protein [Desulfomonile tiedjei]|nr:NAD-binding protein [Desulfomonile tiedjei]